MTKHGRAALSARIDYKDALRIDHDFFGVLRLVLNNRRSRPGHHDVPRLPPPDWFAGLCRSGFGRLLKSRPLSGGSLMSKFFLLLVVCYLIFRLVRWLQPKPGQREAGTAQTAPDKDETFQACTHCGVLVPESEGVRVAGRFFCSPEHVRPEQS